MIHCIAIDDEPLALKQLISYIDKLPGLHLTESFSNAVKALEYLQHNNVDLMFVDINMPDLSGMEFVKSLTNPPKVIFTTAYREFALEGFQVDAADYLVKPISFAAFAKSVEKTQKRYFAEAPNTKTHQDDERFLFIKTEYKVVRVKLADIKYIEGMRDYVRIHLEHDKPIMALMNMGKIQERLPVEAFMRVHRSYIVNLNKIQTIERNRIVFDHNIYIPVSDQYKDAFQEFINNNFLK